MNVMPRYNHRTTSLIEDMQIAKTNNNGTSSPFLGPLPLQVFFGVKSPVRLFFFFLGGGEGKGEISYCCNLNLVLATI